MPAGQRDSLPELAPSGLALTVPEKRSILDVVTAAGVTIASSCGEKTCGTCETFVLAGTVNHRDSVLSAAERETKETLMICVSRAACLRLVLDL